MPYRVLLVTAWQVVPVVGQSFGVAVHTWDAFASQRQMGRQVCVAPMRLQMRPGAQSAACVQSWPSVFVRVGSRQEQSTWSIEPGITQTSPVGQPPRLAAAAARGSQLKVQVWYAVRTVGHMTGPWQKLPGPPPPAPTAAQPALSLQKRRHSFTGQPELVPVM
jgi:hypothetical protein